MNTNRLYFSEKGDLSYDCVGNLVTDEDEYDYENRITKITMDVNDIAQFAYDALGRRIRKTDSKDANNTKLYYYNNNWQVLYEASDSGSVTKSLLYGNYIDEVIFMRQNLAPRWFVHDHLYSPVALTNTSGTVLERYEYDAYGHCTFLEPNFTPLQTQESQYANNYLFTGRRLDILDNGSLKIQYNRNRYYDTHTGRFTTHDPIGITPNPLKPNKFSVFGQYSEGLNLYQYAKSNPINYVDPYGLLTCNYKVACRKIRPVNWKKKLLRRLNIRHCGLYDKSLISKKETIFPVWLMAHPKSRKLQAGKGKGCACKCARCDQIQSCVAEIKKRYSTGSYWPNCHTQTKRAIDACCLKSTWKPAFFAF